MRLKTIYILLVFVSLQLRLYAQDSEREQCATSSNEKAVKLYKDGTDKKKFKKEERMDFLKKAIELDPDYVAANFLFAFELERTLNYKKASIEPCEKYFLKVVENCPNYHADAYYFLAEISFDKEEYKQAFDYYEKFLKFKSDDDDAFSKDYEKKRNLAKEKKGWADFYMYYYTNKVPFNPQLVAGVSTKGNQEYLPLISPDNEKMYFTRRMEVISKIQRNIYQSDTKDFIERFCVSNFNELTGFDEGTFMPYPFNEGYEANYGGVTLSIDNKHLFLTICKPGQVSSGADANYINCDIYTTDYVYGMNEKTWKEEWHWTELRNLGPNVNTPDGWESQPTLSADGKTLYFASVRKDSRGIDIYYTQKQEDGSWGMAVNLGEPINTEYNDKTPFLHSDSHTLYFASEGHYGFGSFDVFYSKMDENGVWMTPKNLGSPINTEGSEHGFIVSTDGEKVYFASNNMQGKNIGGYDIFSFDLYEEARPEHVVFLKGSAKDEHHNPIKNAKVEMKNVATGKTTSFDVDTVDGTFAAIVTVKENQDVIMKVKAEDKVFNATYFKANDILKEQKEKGIHLSKDEVTETTTPSDIHRSESVFKEVKIELQPIAIDKPFKINDIYYTTNSANLTEESKNMLKEFAAFLNENPSLKIDIHGHTDNQGVPEKNLTLSADRAFSVMAFLQENGVAKDRLAFQGFGQNKPIAPNNTEDGRAKNRRTEFVIVSK
jgi:outer membrane protein OmpA-like peptidoglycan-associated protein